MSEDRKNSSVTRFWPPFSRWAVRGGLVFMFSVQAVLADVADAAAAAAAEVVVAADAPASADDAAATVANTNVDIDVPQDVAAVTQAVTNATDSSEAESAAAPDVAIAEEHCNWFIPIERDPFWPVGFDPNPPPPPVAADDDTGGANKLAPKEPPKPKLPEPGKNDWLQAQRQLKYNVGSSSTPDGDKQYFAFMNNKLMSVGQVVETRTHLFHFTWRVVGVTPTGVRFKPLKARRLSDGTDFKPLEE